MRQCLGSPSHLHQRSQPESLRRLGTSVPQEDGTSQSSHPVDRQREVYCQPHFVLWLHPPNQPRSVILPPHPRAQREQVTSTGAHNANHYEHPHWPTLPAYLPSQLPLGATLGGDQQGGSPLCQMPQQLRLQVFYHALGL